MEHEQGEMINDRSYMGVHSGSEVELQNKEVVDIDKVSINIDKVEEFDKGKSKGNKYGEVNINMKHCVEKKSFVSVSNKFETLQQPGEDTLECTSMEQTDEMEANGDQNIEGTEKEVKNYEGEENEIEVLGDTNSVVNERVVQVIDDQVCNNAVVHETAPTRKQGEKVSTPLYQVINDIAVVQHNRASASTTLEAKNLKEKAKQNSSETCTIHEHEHAQEDMVPLFNQMHSLQTDL